MNVYPNVYPTVFRPRKSLWLLTESNREPYAYEALVDGDSKKSCIQSLVSPAISIIHVGTQDPEIRTVGASVSTNNRQWLGSKLPANGVDDGR